MRAQLVSRDTDARFYNALQAEFGGVLLLQLLAAVSGTSIGYAFAYAVLVYATQLISGGHLNPAVTLATAATGHLHWIRAVSYIVAQLLGGVVGAALEALLVPGLHLGHNKLRAPGCFHPSHVNSFETLLWELVLTLLVVYVVYSVAVAEPGHGNAGPLAIGLAVLVAGEAGGQYTGALVNPARVIGPAIVFLCSWRWIWVYLLGQVLGALIAGALVMAQYGPGAAYSQAEYPGEERTDPLLGTPAESRV